MKTRNPRKQKILILPFFLLLILVLATLFTKEAFADVNLKDGSFNYRESDVISEIGPFVIERSYSSRSLSNGLFGFGWCSPLDAHIRPLQNNQLRIVDCEGETVLESTGRDTNTNTIRRTKPDGTVQVFDLSGRLVSLRSMDGASFDVRYAGDGSYIEIRTRSGQLYRAEVDTRNGKIKRLGTRRYFHLGDDLIQSGDSSYQYDKVHNLIRITQNGKTESRTLQIQYQLEEDRVLSLKTSDGCQQTFTYTVSPVDPVHQYTSHVTKICDGLFVVATAIEFTLATTSAGAKYLARAKWTRGKELVQITYDPSTGLPSRISRKGPTGSINKETI